MSQPSADSILRKLHDVPAMAPVFAALDASGLGRLAVVGGAVRDLALGLVPLDIDLVLEGAVGPLADRLGDTAHVHTQFETATVELPDGAQIDIARARTETYSTPGALPVTKPASLEVDLVRRDFTINAIALELLGADAARLLAVPEGLEDLERRRLAVLHKRSFIDDPTRLLRLARYRGRFGFEIAPATRALASDGAADGALGTVSGDRIGHELMLLARESDPGAVLSAVEELGLGRPIAKAIGLKRDDAKAVKFGAADRDLLALAQTQTPDDGRPDLLALAVFFRRVSADTLPKAIGQLGLPAAERDTILAAATRSEWLSAALTQSLSPSEIDLALAGERVETIALAAALADDSGCERADLWLTELRHRQLLIDGNDLLAAGIAAGPSIGAGLLAARAAMLDGEAEDREAQLAVALVSVDVRSL